MTVSCPTAEQIPQLLALWKDAFGDWNGFWETFLETGFSPKRCRCALEAGQIIASLTWLDCSWEGEKIAYIYAVVTHPDHRGRGLCRRLLADTHAFLEKQGYAAAMLVPAGPELRKLYEKLGYRTCTWVEDFSCLAAETPVSIRAVGPEEFARLRRKYLPPDAVLQEGENLSFLARQAQFYAGADFLLAAYQEGDSLTGLELLGNRAAAPGILGALGCTQGHFRGPGNRIPFAMLDPLKENVRSPAYFGFAFD